MRIGSLFSGIGGLDLAVEQATGGRVVWQVEQDPFCQRVLAKHWPDAEIHGDIRDATNLPTVDLICGGFPCQDISQAGKGAGIDGEKSGLWREYHRIVRDLLPQFVFVENVRALTARGLGRVLGDLATLGYNAEWDVLGACCVGAPHRRERLFILATRNAHGYGQSVSPVDDEATGVRGVAAHTHGTHGEGNGRALRASTKHAGVGHHGRWQVEPGVGPVADGVPGRMARLRALGNAVVPAQGAAAFQTLWRRLHS